MSHILNQNDYDNPPPLCCLVNPVIEGECVNHGLERLTKEIGALDVAHRVEMEHMEVEMNRFYIGLKIGFGLVVISQIGVVISAYLKNQ